ncbi:MAG: hypothetical protein ACOCZ3_01005 [Bacillota bacterium]
MKKRIVVLSIMVMLIIGWAGVVSAEETEEQLVSALYFETDIREALNDLMLQTGVNIIADDTVRGLVSVDLVDVTLEKALMMVLLGGGYSYRKIDDYYVVSMADPRSPAFRHMSETENVRLKYVSASEARSLLPGFYDPFLRSSDERDIITITATPEIIQGFKEDLERIDTPPQQIKVQAIVTEVSSDLVKEFGSDLFDLLINDPVGDDGFLFDDNTLEFSWYGNHERILANLRALEQNEQLEIKADPRVVVSDRGTGSLFIGEEQVIILEPEDASARLERVEVGVSLEVTPKIIGGEQIQLTLTPSISHFTEEADKNLRIRRSEISTTIYTKNNETLVMAGMTIDSQSSKDSKVPLLGDIPLIRWFFRRTEEQVGERELLIFITPEIINSEG